MDNRKQSRPKNPSFSSSLLDAIYRSIDDSNDLAPSLPHSSTDQNFSQIRCTLHPSDDRGHRRFFSATISSDCPRFAGFSSYDFESATLPPPVLTRSNRIRTDPPSNPQSKSSIRSIRTRIRDLQKSPGARLASFVNSFFAGGGDRNPNKHKFAGRVEDPACASSSYHKYRRKKENVGISPVSVGCGDPAAAARDRRMRVEFFSGLETVEDEEDCESVSSSDLFELESLSLIGRFTDELPVYETTNLSSARGFIA